MEAVQFQNHLCEFGADPANGFKDGCMLDREVWYIKNFLMVENMISKIANFIYSFSYFFGGSEIF